MTDYILGDANGLVSGVIGGATSPPPTQRETVRANVVDTAVIYAEPDLRKRRTMWRNPPQKNRLVVKQPVAAKCAEAAHFYPEGIVVGQALPFPRKRRDELLTACDKWGAMDFRASKPADTVAAWDQYRRALRDLPAETTDNWAVVWPTPPAS